MEVLLQKTSKTPIFSFLVIAFSVLFLWLIKDFFIPISIAIVLTVIFFPVKKKIAKLTKERNSLATSLTVILILISVTFPTFLAGTLVYKQSTGFYQQFIQSKTVEEIELNLIDTAVRVSKEYYPYSLNEDSLDKSVTRAAQSITKWVSDQTLIIGQNTPLFSVYIFLILYITYVLLKNANTILKDIVRFSPLGEEFTQLLLLRVATITRGVVKGTFVIGVIQGLMGGLLFWALGINTALTWGFIMIILSIIPVVGAGIVWIPAGLILLASGAIWQGITLLLAGFLLIGSIDNLLRPYMIGKSTKLPESIILLSMLGGIASFGLIGFVIGPIIAGILYTLLETSQDQIDNLSATAKLSNH